MTEMKRFKNYINGRWTEPASGNYYKNINPADRDDVIGEFPLSTEADMELAVEAADRAFKTWGSMLPKDRTPYMEKFIKLMDERKEEIARAMCRELGKTYKDSLAEPVRGCDECSFIIGEGLRMEGITMPSDRHGVVSVANRVPLGVVAAITPWNFPFLTPLRKIFPAIAAGNTVVFKPALETPHSAVLLMELFHDAGFPEGVVNMVIGRGSVVGDALCAHPKVRVITFTGSTGVGRHINTVAARHFAKVQLEMGGKNPAIVADFKDLDYAAQEIVNAAYALAGQRCTSISRVIVLEEQAEALEALLIEKIKRYKLGNGMDPDVTMGPVVNDKAGSNIMAYIESAVAEGATIKLGGRQLTGGIYDKGFYIEPTLITDVTPDMKVAREEIFGPVLVVLKAKDFEEALNIANDTEYGLSSAVFTDDLEKIYAFMQQSESGMVHINHGTVTDGNMPFGGVKGSGLGDFSKGVTNKNFFTQLKVVYTKFAR